MNGLVDQDPIELRPLAGVQERQRRDSFRQGDLLRELKVDETLVQMTAFQQVKNEARAGIGPHQIPNVEAHPILTDFGGRGVDPGDAASISGTAGDGCVRAE